MILMIDGRIRMPSVPPAAMVVEARLSEWPWRRMLGSATLAIVAAVA